MLLRQLLLFNALHPYKSFREAASALQIPESTIRTTMHQLESELNCTLLTTDKYGIHWTAVANDLWPHTEVLVQKNRALQRLPDLVSEAFAQPIAIASSSHYGSLLLTELISEILTEHPMAQFSLATLDSQTLLQRLLIQAIDFALLRIHDIEEPFLNSTLHSLPLNITPLYKDQMCFLVGPKHPLYNAKTATLQEILHTSRLISKDSVDKLTMTFFQKNGYNNTLLQISNIISLRHLINSTNFISWQSTAAAQNSLQQYNDQLHILKPADTDWSCTTYCVNNKTPTFGERILYEKLLQLTTSLFKKENSQ